MKYSQLRANYCLVALTFLTVALLVVPGCSQRPQWAPKPTGPWADTSLSPDARADLVIISPRRRKGAVRSAARGSGHDGRGRALGV